MYLLDTCALLWFMDDSDKLSKTARDVIGKNENIFVSIVSFWEIAIKKSIGKLDIAETVSEIRDICVDYGFSVLPIKVAYLERIQQLPFLHNDPFDRLIMATAMEEELRLITHDANIERYDVDVFW